MREAGAFFVVCAGLFQVALACHPGAGSSAAMPSTTARPAVHIDSSWVAPGLRPDRLFKVAVLPVCRLAGEAESAHQVVAAWLMQNPRVGVLRLDDAECVTRLGGSPRERDSALALVAREIAIAGRPGAETSRWLARRLGVVALVALRVDRWEAGSGVRDMAYVDLTAALVDSSGNLLWRIAGRARAENPRLPTHLPPDPVPVVHTETTYRAGSSSGGSSSSSSSSHSASGSSSNSSAGAQSGGGSSSSSSTSASASSSSSGTTSYRQSVTESTTPPSVTWPIGEVVKPDAPYVAALDTLLRAFALRLSADSAEAGHRPPTSEAIR